MTAISLGSMTWGAGHDASTTGYDFANVANINTNNLQFANPETISVGTMTLLKANNTLAETPATEKNVSYQSRLIASGVTMDGKATGTADGFAIRGADTSGGSLRGEMGASVTPDKNVPLTLDFNVAGFAGKKHGFSGGVSVVMMF